MANSKKLTDKDYVSTMADSDAIIGNFGGKVGQMKIEDFRSHLNDNENQVLNDLAFYIDINTPSAMGEDRVDIGGNLHMRDTLFGMRFQCLMDANGNYTKLNPNDGRYLNNGEAIVDMETGEILDKWKNCDIMLVQPKFYGKIQTVTNGVTTKQLPWFSPIPLPGGFEIPQMVVGVYKFCAGARSLPNKVPNASKTGEAFWDEAQNRSKNHGLAGWRFQNWALFYMMSNYAYRDSQGCKTSDGTLVWGVGLDGTESTGSDKFTNQKSIKTGACLALGINDGKSAVADAEGTTVHCVNVGGVENPWGQYWEYRQGLCSVGDDVYVWDSNVIPHVSQPTAETFKNIPHIKAHRNNVQISSVEMNILSDGVVMIPKKSASGINYKDFFWYSKGGQSWWFGGYSSSGSSCGLALAYSNSGWRISNSNYSARLAYYGDVKEVTAEDLAAIAS